VRFEHSDQGEAVSLNDHIMGTELKSTLNSIKARLSFFTNKALRSTTMLHSTLENIPSMVSNGETPNPRRHCWLRHHQGWASGSQAEEGSRHLHVALTRKGSRLLGWGDSCERSPWLYSPGNLSYNLDCRRWSGSSHSNTSTWLPRSQQNNRLQDNS